VNLQQALSHLFTHAVTTNAPQCMTVSTTTGAQRSDPPRHTVAEPGCGTTTESTDVLGRELPGTVRDGDDTAATAAVLPLSSSLAKCTRPSAADRFRPLALWNFLVHKYRAASLVSTPARCSESNWAVRTTHATWSVTRSESEFSKRTLFMNSCDALHRAAQVTASATATRT
jgi:hypothetical protein